MGGVERQCNADQGNDDGGFTDVLETLVAARDSDPVPESEGSCGGEKRPGGAGQRRLVLFLAARRAGAAFFLAGDRFRVVGREALPP